MSDLLSVSRSANAANDTEIGQATSYSHELVLARTLAGPAPQSTEPKS